MKSKWTTTALLSAVILMAFSWLGTGCSGGGGGPTSPPPPTVPPSGISFSPDSSAGPNSIYLSSGGGSGSTFILDVDTQSVTDLYGVSFLLTYPDNLISFRKNSELEGTFLSESGSVDTDLQVSQRQPGEITVGISRLGEVPGATGSGNLLSLEFGRKAAGSGSIQMTDHDALDSFGEVQIDVTWIGGSVTVR